MSNQPDVYAKLMRAVPDILRTVSELYVQGRTSPTQSSATSVSDELNERTQDYKSLTGVRPAFKPFIIGFIPPDILPNFIPVSRTNDSLQVVDTGTAVDDSLSTDELDTSGVKANSKLPDKFYEELTKLAHRIGARPSDLLLVLYTESGLNPAAGNHIDGDKSKPIQARGISQFTLRAIKSAGMDRDFWENKFSKLTALEQLPYVEKFFKKVGKKGRYENVAQLKIANFAPGKLKRTGNPSAVLYARFDKNGKETRNWKQNNRLNPNGDITVGNLIEKINRVGSKSGFLSQLARLKNVSGAAATSYGAGTPDPGTITGAADVSTSTGVSATIMRQGNINSPDPEDQLKFSGRNIVISSAERLEKARIQSEELTKQIEVANRIPSLLMLINPSEFTRNYEHQIDTPKGRRGQIVHMWLEKPLSISSKGVTAAQYVVGPAGGGLTNINRLHSLSYVNLMSLVMMYRNNGHLYTQTSGAQNYGIPVISMSIFIYYDGHIYIGSFDDFSVTDAADKPYNLSYNWKFTARYDFAISAENDQSISSSTSSQFTATAFPSEMTISINQDKETRGKSREDLRSSLGFVPSPEPGPTPTTFPIIPPGEAPTGVAPDVQDPDVFSHIDF